MSGKKILVVEDDPSIRRVIALALKSGGYADVQEVESGDVAVEVAFEKRPDLVLLQCGGRGASEPPEPRVERREPRARTLDLLQEPDPPAPPRVPVPYTHPTPPTKTIL